VKRNRLIFTVLHVIGRLCAIPAETNQPYVSLIGSGTTFEGPLPSSLSMLNESRSTLCDYATLDTCSQPLRPFNLDVQTIVIVVHTESHQLISCQSIRYFRHFTHCILRRIALARLNETRRCRQLD
jgi:hypothetical protein